MQLTLFIQNIRRNPRIKSRKLLRIFSHFLQLKGCGKVEQRRSSCRGVKWSRVARSATSFTTQKKDKKSIKPGVFVSGNRLCLTLGLLVLSGCANLNSGWNGSSDRYNDTYAQSDFDELLAFGANMAQSPPASQAKVCRILLKSANSDSDPGILLHLMIGRLLSDSCGEIPKILNGVASIPPGRVYDERLKRLVSINTEALKRMNSLSKKVGSMEHKQKKVQSVLESKDSSGSKDSIGSKKNETRLLREKLEAIRSMEKHLDETGDAN